jgi:hypothetical protein
MGVTSDEFVYSVAERKRKLTSQLQDVMRAAAVDCDLWRDQHQQGNSANVPTCFSPRKDDVAGDAGDGAGDGDGDGALDENEQLYHGYSIDTDIATSRRRADMAARAVPTVLRDRLTGLPVSV